MKNIKYNLLVIGVLLLATVANAQHQSVTIDASQMVSTFSFVDSDDNKQNVDYEGIFTGSYGVGYRHILPNNVVLRGGIGKRNGGANYVYDEMNYSWKLEYVDLRLGGGYMYDLNRISPYIVVSGYYGYMLRGIQVLNNEEFNISDAGILNKSDIGIVINPGINMELSKYISTFIEFNYTRGLNNIETDESQKAQNVAYGLTLGLSFTITK